MFKLVKLFLTAAAFIVCIMWAACDQVSESGSPGEFPVLTGDYLGQTPPGSEAQLFAPGIISTGLFERDFAMTPDGNELYFCIALGRYNYTAIMYTKRESGRWSEPKALPFASDPDYLDFEPHVSPDGQKLLFLSTRPDPERGEPAGDQDIWAADRVGDWWGEPYNLGLPVCSDAPEYFPSVTNDGTIYFTREGEGRRSEIYRARLVDGSYQEAERLGENVNFFPSQYNSFIAADESYLITCAFGGSNSRGADDYYIIFRNDDDTWSEPVNMGDAVNSKGSEQSPFVTRDGKYFIFSSSQMKLPDSFATSEKTLGFFEKIYNSPENGNFDIYWIDASFIEELRPGADK